MKRQGIFLRTVKSRNRGRASERAVCGVFSDFSLAEPASRPAYAPTTKSPARYRAGRAKQRNHARNVKPLPPRRSPGRAVPAPLSGPRGLRCRGKCPGERPYTSAPLGRWAVPAAMSGPGGLHCRGQCLGERPYTSAPLSFGLCPLPCPAQEVCVAGESTPGLFLDFPPSPRAGGAGCTRSLVRPIFLCYSLYHAPGLFPCFFILPLAGPAHKPPSLRTCRNKPGAV